MPEGHRAGILNFQGNGKQNVTVHGEKGADYQKRTKRGRTIKADSSDGKRGTAAFENDELLFWSGEAPGGWNDKRGSRAYPSRTSYGQTWEIGKSYPWLTEPLRVFGIPISKPLFGIYWVLTNAQIELLAMDVSIVVTDYDKDNKEKKHDTKNFKSPSVSEIEDAAKRWKDKYGNGETAININDYK